MRSCGLLVLLVCCACEGLELRTSGGYMQTRVTGDVALGPSSGPFTLSSRTANLDNDLGLGGGTDAVFATVEGRKDGLVARITGFRSAESGVGVLDHRYGDISAGTSVGSRFEFLNVKAGATYDVFDADYFSVGLGAAANLVDLDWDVVATSGGASESIRQEIVLPMPVMRLRANEGPVALSAELGAIAGSLGDLDGQWVDFEAMLEVQVHDNIDLVGGYRWIRIDNDGRAADRLFQAKVELRGWFVGMVVHFMAPRPQRPPSLH